MRQFLRLTVGRPRSSHFRLIKLSLILLDLPIHYFYYLDSETEGGGGRKRKAQLASQAYYYFSSFPQSKGFCLILAV